MFGALRLLTVRDEAFELGLQWAGLYPEGSPSRALIQNVMNTSYLVNIVANDFKDGSGIFEPFQLSVETAAAPVTSNGVINGATDVINGLKESARELVNGLSHAL